MNKRHNEISVKVDKDVLETNVNLEGLDNE